MTDSAYSRLGQAELVGRATDASRAGDSAVAIAYLQEAVARDDATAIAHYLLGAELAQTRQYEQAIDAMEAALALDPTLAIVRIQLGMLWMGQNVASNARATLAPLLELPADGYLHLVGAGLLALLDDRLEDAARLLTKGQALNTANVPLNGDLQRIVNAIAQAQPTDEPPAELEKPAHDEDLRHVLLSAYVGNTRH
jgi:Flp pilus assembly protein TadD